LLYQACSSALSPFGLPDKIFGEGLLLFCGVARFHSYLEIKDTFVCFQLRGFHLHGNVLIEGK
jgi:hypothetical protein